MYSNSGSTNRVPKGANYNCFTTVLYTPGLIIVHRAQSSLDCRPTPKSVNIHEIRKSFHVCGCPDIVPG